MGIELGSTAAGNTAACATSTPGGALQHEHSSAQRRRGHRDPDCRPDLEQPRGLAAAALRLASR
eukprot:CAMPEP_0119516826 /NCGR_PEP_ID=MMETSP1344-20130328/33909_1 /TAXON_ID=236787 /ORGANISM="Florenciella parvula, Strain CCMP2471" /LENGTH=63 /DNA_ID=CAMNT_0007554361 /DNA_START=213 /DNA_END=400 /DNA_ORIENTATION=+